MVELISELKVPQIFPPSEKQFKGLIILIYLLDEKQIHITWGGMERNKIM